MDFAAHFDRVVKSVDRVTPAVLVGAVALQLALVDARGLAG